MQLFHVDEAWGYEINKRWGEKIFKLFTAQQKPICMDWELFLSLVFYLLKDIIKWLEQLFPESQDQGVGGEECQKVVGASFGACTCECLIPNKARGAARELHMCSTWMGKKRKPGKGCRAKSQSHLKSVAELHWLRLALSPDFICSEGLLVQLLICADEQ